MNLSFIIIFLFIKLLVNHFSLEVIACNIMSRIDSMTHLDYLRIKYVLTSNGYYYIIKEDDISNNPNEFIASGKIPDLLDNCCDSAVMKDIAGCNQEEHNKHTIAFLKYSSGESQYISLDIKSLIHKEDVHIWSEPKPVINDVILSNADIDYSQKIDAIFNTDNSGEIFFVQGEYYSGIEFQDCPQTKEDIVVHRKRPLTELGVYGKIDSAYYEITAENDFLYFLLYDQMQFYKVEIDENNTQCAPNDRYNSSQYTANKPSINISSNASTIAFNYSLISIIFNFIIWYLIN